MSNGELLLKKKIKEWEREYDNILHWDLDAEYLERLKVFLMKSLIG